MAKITPIDLDKMVRDELKQLTVTMTVTVRPPTWQLRLRLWLVTRILTLGAWVAGCGFEVEDGDIEEKERLAQFDEIIDAYKVEDSHGVSMISLSMLHLFVDVLREDNGLEPYYADNAYRALDKLSLVGEVFEVVEKDEDIDNNSPAV